MYKEGNRIVLEDVVVTPIDKLDVGVYSLSKDTGERFILTPRDSFELPKKLYGDVEEKSDKFISTFNKMDKNLGILFTGYKGSGKSLMAKVICDRIKLPVITISEGFEGTEFMDAIASISAPVVIFLDEFEKVYADNQNSILTLLDGVYEGKKMFILTSNTLNVSEFLLNRLGRIRYHKHYDTLEESAIRQVIEDFLDNKSYADDLVENLQLVGNVSYDNVIGVIEEMNLHKIPPAKALNDLSISVTDAEYDVTFIYKGHRGEAKTWGHPLSGQYFYLRLSYIDKEEKEKYEWYHVPVKELKYEAGDGNFSVEDKDGNRFYFTMSRDFKFTFHE